MSKATESVKHLLPLSVLVKRQTKEVVKEGVEFEGQTYRKVVAEIRFDDQCGNGHNTFTLTGSAWAKGNFRQNDPDTCGSIHDLLSKAFPELKHLIKWHGVTSDGPLAYLGNTLFLSGDRDYNGHRAGDANSWDTLLKFGDFPILVEADTRFREFLLNPELDKNALDIEAVEYPKKSGDFDYKPKYTLKGFVCQWYQCPFDSLAEAQNFLKALQTYPITEEKIVTGYSKGKAPELEAARRAAAWPDATLEQLQDEKLLLERLPALMQEFKNDMESLGFTY